VDMVDPEVVDMVDPEVVDMVDPEVVDMVDPEVVDMVEIVDMTTDLRDRIDMGIERMAMRIKKINTRISQALVNEDRVQEIITA